MSARLRCGQCQTEYVQHSLNKFVLFFSVIFIPGYVGSGFLQKFVANVPIIVGHQILWRLVLIAAFVLLTIPLLPFVVKVRKMY